MESNSIYLTRQQAADYLNIKKSTLEAWATRGGGPNFCKFGHTVRYRRQDVDTFAKQNVFKSTSEITKKEMTEALA